MARTDAWPPSWLLSFRQPWGRQAVRVRVGLDDPRRQEQIELRLTLAPIGAAEQPADDGDAGKNRNTRLRDVALPIAQPAQHDRLPLLHEHLRHRLARRDH